MRILIELPTWLGDSIMTTPAIETIVDYYAEAEITLIGSRISIEALCSHPKVNNSLILEKNYFAMYRFAKNLGKYDLFFSFRKSFRSQILKIFINSENKFEFDKKKFLISEICLLS